ncbi:LysR family transcriptional regulator substrate-binding protein [Brachybacterium sp. GPGPB12]|uniref:LysR family transcriptional regulator substrate-binding protein n=1 Tax=Brachybacterium sp. GPGPB12 TaxID=3023517 RepID=UPI0031345E71
MVIGRHPSVSAGFLPGVIAGVHAEHPLLRIQLTEHTTPDLVSGIAAGRFDIAIHSLASDPPSSDLLSVHLWTEHFVAVVPPGHPLAPEDGQVREPLEPAGLTEHPLIAIARPGAAVDPDTGARAAGLGARDPAGLAVRATAVGGEPCPGGPRRRGAERAGREHQRHHGDGGRTRRLPRGGTGRGGDAGPPLRTLAERRRRLPRDRRGHAAAGGPPRALSAPAVQARRPGPVGPRCDSPRIAGG